MIVHLLMLYSPTSNECVCIHCSSVPQDSIHMSHPVHLPPPGLVDTLGNEVCWERVLKFLPVFEGVVDLGVRHAATLKPAVEHLGDSTQGTFAAARGDGQMVNAGVGASAKGVKLEQSSLFRRFEERVVLIAAHKSQSSANVRFYAWPLTSPDAGRLL